MTIKDVGITLWIVISRMGDRLPDHTTEIKLHGSRHKRKHPKGRRKKGQQKRKSLRKRRKLRTGGK